MKSGSTYVYLFAFAVIRFWFIFSTGSIISGVSAFILGIYTLCFCFCSPSSKRSNSLQLPNIMNDSRVTETTSLVFGSSLFAFFIAEFLLIFYLQGNAKTAAAVITMVLASIAACYIAAKYKTDILDGQKKAGL